MKIKRIKKIKVNSRTFAVNWVNRYGGADFCYSPAEINIYTKGHQDSEIFMMICHELMEICAEEMSVRMRRTDCDSDYIFVYDHRQHTTMMEMFSSLISEFIA